MDEIRIDKWLWDVRLYKTRSQAADACHKGRVTIGDMTVKASRPIKVGEVVEVKKNPVVYRYKILGIPKSRVSAKLVLEYLEDLTPEQEILKIDLMRADINGRRDPGTGRPTKRDRRMLDIWMNGE
ncbi:MAG: RNA-binding S4 domain-containing protein [Salinivirgaceae bacterium]|nr:RNA-binding S4 domain-containing protein [Salinivirgaceae bacterium]